MQSPKLEGVDLRELLAEQHRRRSTARVKSVRNNVLHSDETQPAILLRLVKQQLWLFHARRSVDQTRVAVMESHSAGAAWIRHTGRDLR